MRTVLGFTLLVAGICASVVPEPSFEPGTVGTRDSRFITGPIENQIIEAIEDISQGIRNEGLDPFYVEKEHFAYELPVPVIFNAAAFLEEVLATGLSDIVVNYMNYSLFLSRLNFEIELPHIHFSSRATNGEVTVFGEKVNAASDGRVDVRRTIILGVVRVNVGIISGISIRDVTIDFTLGRITSNIRLSIQGINYSQEINEFISQTVPAILQEYSAEVNELIAIILLDIINENIDF